MRTVASTRIVAAPGGEDIVELRIGAADTTLNVVRARLGLTGTKMAWTP